MRPPALPSGSYGMVSWTEDIHDVAVTGLKPGFTREQVAPSMAALAGRTEAEILPLFDRPGAIIKKSADEATAQRYQDALERIGCLTTRKVVGFARSRRTADAAPRRRACRGGAGRPRKARRHRAAGLRRSVAERG